MTVTDEDNVPGGPNSPPRYRGPVTDHYGDPDRPLLRQRTAGEQALLDAAVDCLEQSGWDGAQVPDILAKAHASKSSLYHYFGSRESLLAAAAAERYRLSLVAEDEQLLAAGAACATTAEFLDFIAAQLARIIADPAVREMRRARVVVAADAMHRPELRADVARAQELYLDALEGLIADAQGRGLVNPELDARAYAAWNHAMCMGSSLLEGSFDEPERWLSVAIPASLAPLRLPV